MVFVCVSETAMRTLPRNIESVFETANGNTFSNLTIGQKKKKNRLQIFFNIIEKARKLIVCVLITVRHVRYIGDNSLKTRLTESCSKI